MALRVREAQTPIPPRHVIPAQAGIQNFERTRLGGWALVLVSPASMTPDPRLRLMQALGSACAGTTAFGVQPTRRVTLRKPDLPGLYSFFEYTSRDRGRILVMQLDAQHLRVFISSCSEGNPYHIGDTADLNTGLYYKTVMGDDCALLARDANRDQVWVDNPDTEYGLVLIA